MFEIYLVNLDRFDEEKVTLSPFLEEKKEQFKSQKKQKEWKLSQWLRYFIFSKKLEITTKALVFSQKESGRPFLLDSHYDFNISHSNHWLVMAIADDSWQIGIDIETINQKRSLIDIANSYYADLEIAQLNDQPEDLKLDYFYLLWTLKEARLKCDGQGIANGLKDTYFLIDKKEKTKKTNQKIIRPQGKAKGFSYISFQADKSHIASFCVNVSKPLDLSAIHFYEIFDNKTIKQVDKTLIAVSG